MVDQHTLVWEGQGWVEHHTIERGERTRPLTDEAFAEKKLMVAPLRWLATGAWFFAGVVLTLVAGRSQNAALNQVAFLAFMSGGGMIFLWPSLVA